jgi:hypothetical protein
VWGGRGAEDGIAASDDWRDDRGRTEEEKGVKHAGSETLDALEPLLAEIRLRPGLKEKKRGTFYRKGRACLHFHEDPKGLFADLRGPDDWLRLRISDPAEREALVAAMDEVLRAP